MRREVSAEEFAAHQSAAPATPLQTARHAVGAAARIAGALLHGERVFLSEPEIAARRSICTPCAEWDATGYAGLGKCRRCGCSQFKLECATESCPLGKWPPVAR